MGVFIDHRQGKSSVVVVIGATHSGALVETRKTRALYMSKTEFAGAVGMSADLWFQNNRSLNPMYLAELEKVRFYGSPTPDDIRVATVPIDILQRAERELNLYDGCEIWESGGIKKVHIPIQRFMREAVKRFESDPLLPSATSGIDVQKRFETILRKARELTRETV